MGPPVSSIDLAVIQADAGEARKTAASATQQVVRTRRIPRTGLDRTARNA